MAPAKLSTQPSSSIPPGSGRSSVRQLNLNTIEPNLKMASLFTHYEGGQRDEGIDEGATLILHTEEKDSWFWSIPLPYNRTSVGVVGELDYLSSKTAEMLTVDSTLRKFSTRRTREVSAIAATTRRREAAASDPNHERFFIPCQSYRRQSTGCW